ncbi:CDP-diacylglycerol--glycerol-3-phosphate 3-phosphatidyltransferase [Coriobacterium glomerans PW2]|uniref:CDP-diacylglycerol--glycerol-3-phosphate 3-phosphatidyltransferase n=1 Tax=Coriobacterium glomerans (strain ATCC 49209 / DSM 20642 / JCM 10262 / PW2) TaxID=700015 RepID=F2N7Y2_CORGP|nr:CDP-diacylglycerol--glycerol-3-phosphate 3-phosphatidyltransferase [Coriobacterium glomerans]AEB07091.1 CDP-diacylglycerol--glycerol-3-phosphate 3-phosphatidyltransferase [Coriobacterium glomerans PW2]
METTSRYNGPSGPDRGLSSVWTPANVVTCVRIAAIPLFMIFALGGPAAVGVPLSIERTGAFILYAALSLTDKLDGHLARSRDEITDFGKFLDPIADKLLVFAALLIFIEQGTLSAWIVFVILLREFLVSALRMVASAEGIVIAADVLGKWKTAITMVAICAYLLAEMLAAWMLPWTASVTFIADILMTLAVALTIASGIQYFWSCRMIVFRV